MHNSFAPLFQWRGAYNPANHQEQAHGPRLMQILLVVVVAILLFGGRGRISSIMGDMAKGIGAFRKA